MNKENDDCNPNIENNVLHNQDRQVIRSNNGITLFQFIYFVLSSKNYHHDHYFQSFWDDIIGCTNLSMHAFFYI